MPLRSDVCRRLMDVLEKLEPLSEQKGLLKFLRNEDYAGLLNGFVEDTARAVTDYQVCDLKTHSSTLLTSKRSDLSSTKHIREHQGHSRSFQEHRPDNQGDRREESQGERDHCKRSCRVNSRRNTHVPTGSSGPRSLGQTQSCAQRGIPG
jgi:hypothetical protein